MNVAASYCFDVHGLWKGEPNPYYAKTSYLTIGKAKQA